MINVLKYRKWTALLSLLIFGSFIGYYAYLVHTRGYAYSYSIDFEGGTQVLLKFSDSVSSAQLRTILEQNGWPGAVTRDFSSKEILVRVKEYSNDSKGLAEKISSAIETSLPGTQISVMQSESVGPSVGKSLRYNSLLALGLGLLIMLGYIAFRFWSFGFAFGAVVALFHDAIVMLAVFLFLGREISLSLIAAVLTVLGYSVNDTIVIFSRICEGLKTMRGAPLAEIVNVSINATLRRTLLTSISTGLTVLAMLILGGEALRDLSIALLVGIVFGTYSSIFIASPVMMMFYRKNNA